MDVESPGPTPSQPSRDYSRLASTAFAQEHMAVRALVVGAGALGNEVLKNLALLGVHSIAIVDRDRVEASNLTRSVLYCVPAIGRHLAERTPKALFAASRVTELNPEVRVEPHVGEIADLGFGVLRRADVVFCCVDNEMARLELGWACARLGRLVVDGGLGLMNYSSGQVSLFPERDGPCYGCRKGAERRRELLQELQGREDPCWRKDEAVRAADGVATTPLMASVVGAFQVELGLRRVGHPTTDGLGHAYRITLHPTPAVDASSFERSPSCPLHDERSLIGDVLEVPEARSDQWTPIDVLDRAGCPDGMVILDWPMSAAAVCRSCGHRWEPLVRRTRFRKASCPGCGQGDVVETEVLSGLTRETRWSTRTLARLGLPAGHVYEVAEAADADGARVHVEMTGDLAPGPIGAPC
jgi:molybdopterin/thiamine biosynthesis adenylyltransferase/predicted RNA-binding Zn-ribbon protein involved in translation (DUF1610 family)